MQKSVRAVVSQMLVKASGEKGSTVTVDPDVVYPNNNNSSCPQGVAYLKVGWKPRINGKNA